MVPVLYEEDTIAGLLESLASIEGRERCEVIVVDGDPAGGTLGRIGAGDVVKVGSPAGRARQMNAGAAVAAGNVLVFLHADTELPVRALSRIESALAGGAAAGAFRLRFDSDRFIYRVMSAFVTLRSRWNRLPYGDQAIFVRRRFFEELGGYREFPIMEDVDLVRRIRGSGGRLVIVDASVRTSCRRMEAEGVARRVLLNWLMTFLYRIGVPPRRLARFYGEEYRRRPRAGAENA